MCVNGSDRDRYLPRPSSAHAIIRVDTNCLTVPHPNPIPPNSTPDPERDLIAPALAGVENVLGAVDRATNENGGGRGGMRVVLTSSTGGFFYTFKRGRRVVAASP